MERFERFQLYFFDMGIGDAGKMQIIMLNEIARWIKEGNIVVRDGFVFRDKKKTYDYKINIPKLDKTIEFCFCKGKTLSNKDIYSLHVKIGEEKLIIDNQKLTSLLNTLPLFLSAILEVRGVHGKFNSSFPFTTIDPPGMIV